MKYSLINLLLLMLASSCGLFQNIRTNKEKSHQVTSALTDINIAEQKDYLLKSGSIKLYTDSSRQSYNVELWPKGLFSFSPEKGFSGEASRVVITGNIYRLAVLSSLQSSEIQDKGKIGMTLNQTKKQVSDQQQKVKQSSVSWKWILAVLIIMVILGLFIYWKF